MSNKASAHRGRAWLTVLTVLAGFAVAIGAVAHAQGRDGEPQASTQVSATATIATTAATATTAMTPTTASTSAPAAVPPTSAAATSTSTPSTAYYTHAIAEPVRVVIPAIEVDAKLVPVGLLDDGYMEVPPFGLAGWYELGPRPGAGGPAVIVAHVDTKSGPDVFYRLKELEFGAEVQVYDASGDKAVFAVDSQEQQLKSELPVERIWNDTWEPVIRLITCGGDFDRKSKHYLSNVIVYGHLVK